MKGIRRSSLQVQLDNIKRLKALEKQKAELEKVAADTSKPIHLAAIVAVAKIALQIATIVRAIKRLTRRKRS